jgi:hypothetical protein
LGRLLRLVPAAFLTIGLTAISAGPLASPAAASYYFDWVTSVDTDPASTYGVTTVTAGTEVTVVAEAVINPNEFHYLVILDSHNSVVEYCAAATCSALVTSTDATSKTYHAVVGDWDGSNPVSPPSDANITVTVTWTAGPPATLWVGGLPNPYGVGTAGSLTVFADDAYGNVATGYRGTVHFTSTDPAAVLPANHTFTAGDAGTHTFSVTLNTVGTQAVRARDTVTATIGVIDVSSREHR